MKKTKLLTDIDRTDTGTLKEINLLPVFSACCTLYPKIIINVVIGLTKLKPPCPCYCCMVTVLQEQLLMSSLIWNSKDISIPV